jgi:membrane-associated PAP2 superfamily phosphatase
MEASGTPTPPPDAPEPSPPPPTGPVAGEEEKATVGWRALGVLLALALAFAAAVMIIAMIDIGDTPRCDDPAALATEREEWGDDVIECFEGSQTQKVISLGLGWPSGVIAAIAALFALYFAATARHGRLLLRLTGVAIVLGGLSILIGSV